MKFEIAGAATCTSCKGKHLVGPCPLQPNVVEHPAHYLAHPSGVECITITQWMGFNLGNVVKYVWRADLKGNAIEDLKKARQYLDFEISRLESM